MTVSHSQLRRWLPYAIVTCFYLYLAGLLRLQRGGPDWNDFLVVVDQILRGDILHIYANRFSGYHTFAYPPFSALVLLPFRWFSLVMKMSSSLNSLFVSLPYIAFDIISAALIVQFIRRWRSLNDNESIFLFTLYLMSWIVFFSTPYHAHFESMLVSFILLALMCLQRGKIVRGGLLLSVALLVKQTAILVIIPIVLVALVTVRWRTVICLCAATAIPAILVMLPFAVADLPNLKYMLVDLPAKLPFAYQSSWLIFGDIDTNPRFTVLQPRVNAIILLLCILYSFIAARRFNIRLPDQRTLGLCAACTVILVFLEKWGSLHNYQLPFVLLLVWEMTLPEHPWPWVSLLFISVLSNTFILFLSREVLLSFGAATAWGQVLLFIGTLVYITQRLRRSTKNANRGQ